MDLALALQRPGLDARTRLLTIAVAAIGPADWTTFTATAAAARTAMPRADFEEMLLQATLFFGFPRTVTAFEQLESAWPAAAPPQGGEVPVDERPRKGRELFAAIYGKNDAAVRARLLSFHAAFHDFVLEAAYGRILSRAGLDPRMRELLAVAALAALQQTPQLIAHARGALAFGADRPAVREAIWSGLRDDAAADALLRRI